MALSNDLASLFAKTTNDTKETKKESTAYGKIVKQGDVEYVQLDGSDLLTPISSTTVVKDGDRVMVTIKNHTAIVTGDLTTPSASNQDVVEIGNKISDFEIVIADKVSTEQLEAEVARIDKLISDDIEAVNAKFETIEGKVAEIDTIKADVVDIDGKVTAHEAEFTTLRADIADFKDVTADSVAAIEGQFHTLDSDYASFKETTTNTLTANDAVIEELQTKKLDTETANITYANIDFSNIGEAAVEKLFSESGIIDDLIMSDGKVTGQLVGVTITGDLIEGNTVKADKLVIQGEDGLYYKLNVNALGETTASSDEKYQNGLDGSVIVADSITAEKIAVDDLVAFGATIGGFHINNDAIYSGTKKTINNTTNGVFLGDDGQMAVGDTNNYFKYYIDEDGKYKLEIQADQLRFGSEYMSVEDAFNEAKNPEISKTINGYNEVTIPDGKEIINYKIWGSTSVLNAGGLIFRDFGTYDETTGKYKITIKQEGKNVFPVLVGRSSSYSGLRVTVNDNSSITLNGTYSGTSSVKYYWYGPNSYQHKFPTGMYTMSSNITKPGVEFIIEQGQSDVLIASSAASSVTAQLTLGKYTTSSIRISPGASFDNETIWIQMEAGEVATEYEPYTYITNDIYIPEPLRNMNRRGSVADYLDFQSQKIYRYIEIINDVDPTNINERQRVLETPIEESVELPIIYLKDHTNTFTNADSNHSVDIEVSYYTEHAGLDVSEWNDVIAHTTELKQTNEEFVMSALSSYVTKDEHTTEIEEVRTDLQLTSDSFSVSLQAKETEISELNNRLQTVESNIAKHFEFTIDGLIIKAGENEMKLQLDNDIIRFIKNGEEFGNWDGVDFYTGNIIVSTNERAQFGNYAYIPRSDESLMFLKVK